MRMSDTVDTETMKVSEERVTSPKDDDNSATKCDTPPDCSHGNRGEPGPNNKRDMQDGFPLKTFEKEERGTQDQAEKEDGADKIDKSEKPPRKMLSRDSSQDYTDSTGIDLHEFLVNTLKGNPRDRIMLLKLEQDILDFISNNESQQRKFPPMSSYHRMLLHRVAAYFGLDHNVDPSGKSVVINKTTSTRIPDQKFSEHIKDDRADDFQKRYILKRDNSSFDREDSMGDHFISDRSAQDEDTCMSTQQRRQMFRLGVGRSGASRQSSSETETLPRHNDPRPWSSTDSSDSSHRLAPRPPITKASSFSGISPGLVRGDSTASSKSTGRLSKTGSESCSSVGSSSSSLSRPQLPQIPASNRTIVSNTSVVHPNNDTRGAGHPDLMKHLPSQPPPPPLPANDATNYYILPLDASGIPPGSVLVNPHTGKPFIHPDGSAIIYNPATITNVGRSSLQGKTPQQPIQSTVQPQPANHLHSQPEALNAQFGQMSLSQPGPGDSSAPDTRHYPTVYHHHHASPSMVLQGAPPPQQVTSYIVTGPSGGHGGMLQGQPVSMQTPGPNHGYSSSNPGPAAFAGTVLNQPLLQQHTYIQQPMQQVSTCYCASSHHPHCSGQQQPQHYRPPVNPISFNCPPGQNLPQQQVHQAVMPNPASGYQSVPSHLSPLPGNQQSNMGNQLQGMMVQYPQMQAYHHQQVSVPQQQYQQPMFVSCQPGQGAVAVGGLQPCYSLLPPNQHTTMSSTVSFLPAPMMEQLSFPQNSSPCVTQQHPGQQYTGLLPPATGSSMVMLQMTAPPCQQPRAPSPCQRKQPNHKNHHHGNSERTRRPHELQLHPDNAQSSLPLSPALTPCSPGQPPSIKGLGSGLSPITPPLMGPQHLLHPPHHHHHPQVHTAFCSTGQGEAHYSLLGPPLQYKPSIRPSLIHTTHMVTKHQGPLGVWHSRHGRKSGRKPLSSDLS